MNTVMFSLLSESYFIFTFSFPHKNEVVISKNIGLRSFCAPYGISMSFWRDKNTSVYYLIALSDFQFANLKLKKRRRSNVKKCMFHANFCFLIRYIKQFFAFWSFSRIFWICRPIYDKLLWVFFCSLECAKKTRNMDKRIPFHIILKSNTVA